MRYQVVPILIATVLLATSIVGLASQAQAADRALLVGIGRYQTLPEKQFLHGPKNDLKAMTELLTTTLGFKRDDLRVLEDEQATREAILSSVEEWLVEGTSTGDRAYLYFSGHGLQLTDDNGDEQDGLDEALATYDIVSGDTDWQRAIRDDEIETLTAKLKDRVLTIVFDASYSGTVANAVAGESGQEVAGARFLPRTGAVPVKKTLTRGLKIDLAVVDKPDTLTASGATSWNAAASYQVASDDTRKPEDERMGVFTAAYVAGHKAENADANKTGLVSNAELYEHVKSEAGAYCGAADTCKTLDPKLDIPATALGASVSGGYQAIQTTVKAEQLPQGHGTAYVDADPVAAVSDITGKAETGDVTVSIDKGHMLHNGDVFRISITSKEDGHLILLDVNKDGKATQIFPNEFAEKITPLKAHSTLTIPDEYYGFDFEADGTGDNVLVAIVVSDPVDIEAMAPKTRGLKVELSARESLSDIISRLQKTWTDDLENRGIRWSIGSLKYTIE